MKEFFEIYDKAEFFNVAKYTMKIAKRKYWEATYIGSPRLVAAYHTDLLTGLSVFIQKGLGMDKSPRVTLFTNLNTMYVYEEGVIKKYDTTSPYDQKLLDVIVA